MTDLNQAVNLKEPIHTHKRHQQKPIVAYI